MDKPLSTIRKIKINGQAENEGGGILKKLPAHYFSFKHSYYLKYPTVFTKYLHYALA
jgi:hypothetical protein